MSLKNKISNFFSSKSLLFDSRPIIPWGYRNGIDSPAVGGETWYFENNGGTPFTYKGKKDAVELYQTCPPVAAIINRLAQASCNGKMWAINTEGKNKGKESQAAAAKSVRRLMSRPNPMQTELQFRMQSKIYQKIFGYTLIMPIKPNGFPNWEAESIWNIPPYMVEIVEEEQPFGPGGQVKPQLIKAMYLEWKGKRIKLPHESIFILKGITPSFDSLFIPDSPLKALADPIANIRASYESRNVIMRRRGPLFIVSSAKKDASGTQALTEDERNEQELQFAGKYGLRKEQTTAIFTSANIDVKTVGFSTKDLQLLEENKESTLALCDGLNYPPHLLGLIDPTFNNQQQAEKGLYQGSVIPDAMNDIQQWQQFFFGDKEMGFELQIDYSAVPVLQVDKKAEAEARVALNTALEKEWTNGLLKLNRWLELLGEDPMGEDGDIYYPEYQKRYGPKEQGTGASAAGNGSTNNLRAAV